MFVVMLTFLTFNYNCYAEDLLLNWNCQTNRLNSGIPPQQRIILTYTPYTRFSSEDGGVASDGSDELAAYNYRGTGGVNASALDEFVRTINTSAPDINLSSCIYDLQRQLMSHLENLKCADDTDQFTLDCNAYAQDVLIDTTKSLIIAHENQIADINRILPPYIGGGASLPQLSTPEITRMVSQLTNDCGNTMNYENNYLSSEALEAIEQVYEQQEFECQESMSNYLMNL
jgi:hypothetical protein